MTQPNILVIMADQLAPQFMGCYGHKVAKTPHMDALAARGMRFDAAYSNSPLCAPARGAFMTGQLISRVGTYDNAGEFPASKPTFAHYLRGLGYHTCLSGKMHFVGPDQKHGFEDRLTPDIYPADFAWTPNWDKADERIDKWYHNMDVVMESGPAVATFQTDYDDETEHAARRWLIDWARDKGARQRAGEAERPFCLVTGFMHPHDPYVAKPEFWDLYSDDEIDLPEVDMPYEALDPHSKRIMDGIEAKDLEMSRAQIVAARRGYYANTSYFDSKVGALVKTLEDMGEMDNTLIIITSDHGDMLGERGLWFKMSFLEHSARVPMIFAGPGVVEGSSDAPCSLVDLLPSMVEAAGGSAQMFGTPVDGRSLLALSRGEAEAGPAEALGEYCAEMAAAPVFMIRRAQWKYIHCEIDPPQLYDLEADPLERVNLASDPAYADQVAAFGSEVAERWDAEELHTAVLASQHERQAIDAAMLCGAPTHWDFTPARDGSQEYVRNHMDWTIAAARYRYPPV